MVEQSRITLVRAPNPSALTLSGTNSYLIDCGNGEAICIDPGPPIERHVKALIDTADAKHLKITWIVITHGHPDHAPAAAPLSGRTGAKIAAHRNLKAPHDRALRDGETLLVGDTELVAIDAPGHTFDHLVYLYPRERALFTGDTVLGEGTVVIAPPGGAMRAYQTTLARLLTEFPQVERIYGGHGEPVSDASTKLREYIAHRELREAQIIAELESEPRTIPQLITAIYAATDSRLWPAAARQMLAHLLALENEQKVQSRLLDRALTVEERAILAPDWSASASDDAEVVRAELGTDSTPELRLYELTGSTRKTTLPN
ncbi:MAG: MBL fold metallo-hydrolase [Candidatus Eremiobacteraeota bacterium]|nr:MBL fold metallo-hydrolase [Candidatus Eremiobacteraeota bacterium]